MTLRILIAEDDFINQQIALSLLENIGYHADLASNGQQVLNALARQNYDVILMDIHMPEMDGLEATQQIIQQYPKKRPFIIALTSVEQKLCDAAGMDAYLSKPLDINLLKRLLNRCTKQEQALEAEKPAFWQQMQGIWQIMQAQQCKAKSICL